MLLVVAFSRRRSNNFLTPRSLCSAAPVFFSGPQYAIDYLPSTWIVLPLYFYIQSQRDKNLLTQPPPLWQLHLYFIPQPKLQNFSQLCFLVGRKSGNWGGDDNWAKSGKYFIDLPACKMSGERGKMENGKRNFFPGDLMLKQKKKHRKNCESCPTQSQVTWKIKFN